ncbi:MAG: hypothetical protein KBT41_00205, partial [bacterium]|nr:hypothetical protein [Candidatus Colousia faecequi]
DENFNNCESGFCGFKGCFMVRQGLLWACSFLRLACIWDMFLNREMTAFDFNWIFDFFTP